MTVGVVTGAASTSLFDLLTGPFRRADVLAIFPTAIYLEVPDAQTAAGPTGPAVLAIVTGTALRLPCSVVIFPRPDSLIAANDTATIGDGCIQLPSGTIVVRRWWRPRRPRTIGPNDQLRSPVQLLSSLLPPLPTALVGAVSRLETDLTDNGPDVISAAARRLVGLGPGLTPAGDDVMAALLLTLWARPDMRQLLTHVLTDAPPTTSLSATLLRHAARGEGVPQVVDLVDAATAAPQPGDVERLVESLLQVGSSSGTALAHGVRLGLGTISARSDLLTPTSGVAT